jgi:small-conductance mechanosensitive channel
MPKFDETQMLNILWTVGISLGIYVIKSVLLRFIHKRIPDSGIYFRSKRIINGIAFLFFIIGIALIWFKSGGSIITYLGLFSAGLALALKDILMNIAGWLYILLRQPFAVGDRIEIAGIKGDVIDQNIFKFRVIEVGNWVHAEQSTGRIIHIPNYKIFMDPLANYTLGFEYIWDEIRVTVTFECNWRKAKGILEEIVHRYSDDLAEDVQKKIFETSRKYLVYYKNLTPIVYTDVVESGVQLTMRYICEPKMRRFSSERIWEAVLDRFGAEVDIDIAYPTMRRVQI